MALAVALVALGALVLAACGGAGARAVSTGSGSGADGCPVAADSPSATGPVGVDPLYVIVCPGPASSPGADGGGHLLGAGAADALSWALTSGLSEPVLAPGCRATASDVALVFGYRSGASAQADVAVTDCPRPVGFWSGQARAVPPDVALLLQSLVAPDSGGPANAPAAAPDLFGAGTAAASRSADSAGYTVEVGGVEVDPQVPPGVVLLQDPPPGAARADHRIEVILSSAPGSTCPSDPSGRGSGPGGFEVAQGCSPAPALLA